MQIVPLNAVPNQTLSIQLGGQSCKLNVYQTFFGIFMDVEVSGDAIIQGVYCQNKNRIVRSAYLGFLGDFIFVDTQGDLNPYYEGLNDRYQLVYLEQADIDAPASV